MNLEGKKAHLEGTWRAVVGHLEGKGQSQQSLIYGQVIDNIALTWMVFGKSIYTDIHRKTGCHNCTSRRCSNGAGLQQAYTHTPRLSSLTAMPFIGIKNHGR